MTPKAILAASLLFALALAGCTGGSDDDGGGTSTSTSGTGSVGGCVTANGGGACANATASGSATMTSTGSGNSTTNGTTNSTMEHTVRIENNAYSPADITVPVGATVTWEHHDGSTAHTVTADDGSFDSHPACNAPYLPISDCMMDGDTFPYTFATAGDYPYHDKLNTGITGIVRVVAE